MLIDSGLGIADVRPMSEVAEGFASILSGDARWENAHDDSGEPVKAYRFARFGVFTRPGAA